MRTVNKATGSDEWLYTRGDGLHRESDVAQQPFAEEALQVSSKPQVTENGPFAVQLENEMLDVSRGKLFPIVTLHLRGLNND